MQDLHVEAEAPQTPSRRTWPWLAGAAGLVVLLAAGVWLLLAGTVSTGTYDDAVAERDQAVSDLADVEQRLVATQVQLAESAADLEVATADNEQLTAALATEQAAVAEAREAATTAEGALATTRDRATELERALQDAADAVEALRAPATALSLWDMSYSAEAYDVFERAGGDITLADDLIAATGAADTVRDWIFSEVRDFPLLAAIEDSGAEAEAAWAAWLATSPGSDAEMAANQMFYWQLELLILEHADAALDAVGRPFGGLRPDAA